MSRHLRDLRVSWWTQTPVLAVLLFTALAVGPWALFAPESFYRSFPGLGHTWVAVDGPYNEHLVRDTGAAYLAFGALTLAAIIDRRRGLVLGTGIVWLVFSTPHFIYHVATADLLESGADVAVNLLGLASSVLLPVLLFIPDVRSSQPADPGSQRRSSAPPSRRAPQPESDDLPTGT